MQVRRSTVLAAALALGAAVPGFAQDEAQERDPQKQAVLNKLNTLRLSVDFDGTPLEDAVNFLREFSSINIVIDAEVSTKLSGDQSKVTLKVKDLTLKSVLKLMLSTRDLSAVYKEGVVLVVPKGRLDKAVSLQIYDVRDLLVKLQDFPGPKVELVSPSAGAGGPLTGATFSLEEPKSTITEEFITEMVKQNTGDRTWDENPNASITLANGMLLVSQSRRVHEEVRRLLGLLRQFK
jgi:type II secretory pathway component GspD/PulD (secretin)